MKRKINVVFKLLIIFFVTLIISNGSMSYASGKKTAEGYQSDTSIGDDGFGGSQGGKSGDSFGGSQGGTFGGGSGSGTGTGTGIEIDTSKVKGDPKLEGDTATAVSTILGVIRTIGVAASVVTIVIIGLKYMLTSVEGRADYKKAAIPYLVGAIVLMSGTIIVQMIWDMTQKI